MSPFSDPLSGAGREQTPRREKSAHADPGAPSLTMLTLGGLVFLAAGAVLLRADLLVPGLIPFAWAGWIRLRERMLFSSLHEDPLRGMVIPPEDDLVVGRPFVIRCRLEHHLPIPLGSVSLETRFCPGLSSAGHFRFDIPAACELPFEVELIPVRPGPVWFYGFSIVIRAPLGAAPREYVLSLPLMLHAQPAAAQFLRKHPQVEQTQPDRRPIPGQDGEFAELRPFSPGDPPRAIIPSASLRQQKYIIQLSIPVVVGKWSVQVDLNPSTFSGVAGYSPFDHYAAGLPLLFHSLQQAQAPVGLAGFHEDGVWHSRHPRIRDGLQDLVRFRYRTPVSARLSWEERWERFRAWVLWVFGVGTPQLLPPEPEDRCEQIGRIMARLPRIQGLQALELSTTDPDRALEQCCAYTGLEMPTRAPRGSGLPLMFESLRRAPPPHVVVFSPWDPLPETAPLAAQLSHLAKKGVRFHWMLLDESQLTLRPHGRDLLDLEWQIKLGPVLDLLRQSGSVHYYHPLTLAWELPRLLRTIAPGRPGSHRRR
ncbi:hypothetical protein KJ975_08020 [Myxococcota bacterium]|nr:hypothetical protein [Myxococcota bacterium]